MTQQGDHGASVSGDCGTAWDDSGDERFAVFFRLLVHALQVRGDGLVELRRALIRVRRVFEGCERFGWLGLRIERDVLPGSDGALAGRLSLVVSRQ